MNHVRDDGIDVDRPSKVRRLLNGKETDVKNDRRASQNLDHDQSAVEEEPIRRKRKKATSKRTSRKRNRGSSENDQPPSKATTAPLQQPEPEASCNDLDTTPTNHERHEQEQKSGETDSASYAEHDERVHKTKDTNLQPPRDQTAECIDKCSRNACATIELEISGNGYAQMTIERHTHARIITPLSSSVSDTSYEENETISTRGSDEDEDILDYNEEIRPDTARPSSFQSVSINHEKPRKIVSADDEESHAVVVVPSKGNMWRVWSIRAFLIQLGIQLVLLLAYMIARQSNSQLSFPNNDCIYVTGGGFSGFWFTLGRLKSIPDPKERNFVCYSAGCLGAVAMLKNNTMEELYDLAYSSVDKFLVGEIGRYDIVEDFVDGMLDYRPEEDGNDNSLKTLSSSLDRLHILTSATDPQSALPVSQMQSPSSVRELKRLLMQTTWIPHATGTHFTHFGRFDGGMTLFQHPKCNNKVGLAWDFPLLANVLNPLIGLDSVSRFWKMGLEHGL